MCMSYLMGNSPAVLDKAMYAQSSWPDLKCTVATIARCGTTFPAHSAVAVPASSKSSCNQDAGPVTAVCPAVQLPLLPLPPLPGHHRCC